MTPEMIQELRRQRYNATVVGVRRIHEELAVFRIRPDFPIPPHKPGQYGTLGLGNWEPRVPSAQEETLSESDLQKVVKRAYSLSCSILNEKGEFLEVARAGWLEFYIVLVRETSKPTPPALTPRLFMLREGDRLFLGEKITGHYTTDSVKPDDTVLFLSTGTGEAPHNYMLWDLLRKNHRGRILGVCCVRFHRDLGYLQVHEQLMARHANYTYLPLTTREPSTIGHKVYIQDLITSGQLEERLGEPLDPGRTHVFLCGNPKMIGVPTIDRATGLKTYPRPLGVIEILEKKGFEIDRPHSKSPGNIHFEEYW